LTQDRHAQKELDKTLAENRSLLAKIDIVVQDNKMDGKPAPIQAELKHQMGMQMAWWCFLDKTTPNMENQGKHAKQHDDLVAWWCFLDKTTPNMENQGKHAKQHDDLEAALGMMLEEVMLGKMLQATLLGMMLGNAKMETRRETTAKMKTWFLILVAAHELQNLPAWLTLEKLRFVFGPSCHQTWNLPNFNFRQRCALTTEALCKWRPHNSQRIECDTST
jgi:hypothetical protein